MAGYAVDEICFMAAAELARRIASRELSPVDVVDAFLRRIDAKNPTLNAYVTVLGDQARDAAREAERALTSGAALGPLHGVPVAIKDLFDYKAGVRSTYGCRVFANMAVDPEGVLRIYPELVVDEDDRQRWISTRTGALVGQKLAARFGWKNDPAKVQFSAE